MKLRKRNVNMNNFKENIKKLIFLIKELEYTNEKGDFEEFYNYRAYQVKYDCGRGSKELGRISQEIEQDIDNLLNEIEYNLKGN